MTCSAAARLTRQHDELDRRDQVGSAPSGHHVNADLRVVTDGADAHGPLDAVVDDRAAGTGRHGDVGLVDHPCRPRSRRRRRAPTARSTGSSVSTVRVTRSARSWRQPNAQPTRLHDLVVVDTVKCNSAVAHHCSSRRESAVLVPTVIEIDQPRRAGLRHLLPAARQPHRLPRHADRRHERQPRRRPAPAPRVGVDEQGHLALHQLARRRHDRAVRHPRHHALRGAGRGHDLRRASGIGGGRAAGRRRARASATPSPTHGC